MSLGSLVARARRLLAQQLPKAGQRVVKFVMPDNGRGPEGVTRAAWPGSPEAHLVQADGTCSFDGCAERHFCDRGDGAPATPDDVGDGPPEREDGDS